MEKGFKNLVAAASVGFGSLLGPACAATQGVKERADACVKPSDWVRSHIRVACSNNEDPNCERTVGWMRESAINTCKENPPNNQ